MEGFKVKTKNKIQDEEDHQYPNILIVENNSLSPFGVLSPFENVSSAVAKITSVK